VEFLDITAIRH